ncbi:ribosome-associated translation inhibitor RaiA [bacterium]|nr:ribosome-associated translation inhibitor RaiA [bacterium]
MLEENNICVSFVGMDPTDSLRDYVIEKITKKEDLLKDATSINVFLKQETSNKGVKDDFRININVVLPETTVRVEERGFDMYANIDLAMDTLNRRLKRYIDMKDRWAGQKSWRIQEEDDEEDMDLIDDYTHYVPKVSKRKKVDNMSPIEEAEAIERMEMLGYDQFLFKNKETDKISMIYRRRDGTYGLIEPKDEE